MTTTTKPSRRQRKRRHRPATPAKQRQRPGAVIESAIAAGDRQWLQVCAPDLVQDVDEDVQDMLADALNWWTPED